jgi:hypothetical protein
VVGLLVRSGGLEFVPVPSVVVHECAVRAECGGADGRRVPYVDTEVIDGPHTSTHCWTGGRQPSPERKSRD